MPEDEEPQEEQEQQSKSKEVVVSLRLRDVLTRARSIEDLRKIPKAKTAFEVRDLIRQVDDKQRGYEEQRQALLKEHGEYGDDGRPVVPKENQEAFVEAVEELVSAQVEIKSLPISLPPSFKLENLAGALADWKEFFELKE
jgi:hypothetical protein